MEGMLHCLAKGMRVIKLLDGLLFSHHIDSSIHLTSHTTNSNTYIKHGSESLPYPSHGQSTNERAAPLGRPRPSSRIVQ